MSKRDLEGLTRRDSERVYQAEPDLSDDDFGPMPVPDQPIKRRKRKVLEHEQVYISNLPSSDYYERSLMHRDIVNFVHVTT